jgi:hypothetical protein
MCRRHKFTALDEAKGVLLGLSIDDASLTDKTQLLLDNWIHMDVRLPGLLQM